MAEDGRKLVEEYDKAPKWSIHKRVIRPVFGKYLTRNSSFVEYLTEIRDQIDTYINRSSVKRPLNILLAATPGNGKSFLIKELISSIKLDDDLKVAFEEIYIASLESAAELFAVFQRIQSINLEGKVPVVFFDEIDSQVDQTLLYAKFLAPMWDGTFYVGKDKFFLGKSVLFFAGSTLSLEDASTEIIEGTKGQRIAYDLYFDQWKARFDEYVKAKPEKLPDFVDRMDAIIRIPPIREELLGAEWKLEYEDMACMLVKKHFRDVKYVGASALEVLSNELTKASSLRTAEKIVFNSRPLDPETFDVTSLPKRHRVKAEETTVYEIIIEGEVEPPRP